MRSARSYKSNHFFWQALKLFTAIACFYFIYVEIKNNEMNFQRIDYEWLTITNVVFLLSLSILNWGAEILKWKLLSGTSYVRATEESLASLSFSLITPNRIGEYGAKAMYYEKSKRLNIVKLNFIGNLHQLLATLLFGLVGLWVFNAHTQAISLGSNKVFWFVGLVALTIIVFALTKTSYYKKLKNSLVQVQKSTHLKVLGLALLRFIIFSHQFYFLLLIFQVQLDYWLAISTISAMYLIASCVPMLSLFDVVLKSSVAVWLFSFLSIDTASILSISVLMWLFNFALPAILGSYFVLKFQPASS